MAGQGRFPKGEKSEEADKHAEGMRAILANNRENDRIREDMKTKK